MVRLDKNNLEERRGILGLPYFVQATQYSFDPCRRLQLGELLPVEIDGWSDSLKSGYRFNIRLADI